MSPTVQVVEHELEELLGAVGLRVHLENVRAERVPLKPQDDELEELAELVGQHPHVVVVQHQLLELNAVADLGRQGAGKGGIGPRETERGRKGAGGGVNEGPRESGGGRERGEESGGDSSLSGCADGDRGRTDGRDGGIKRCNHSIVLIERPTGRKKERIAWRFG